MEINGNTERFDDIIIGSGIGGLTCAAYLARAGRKVAVFEKNEKPGGCCTSYIKEGYSFAPSVHWLSFCGEDQMIGKVVNELGISDVLKFNIFDPLVRFVDSKRDITLSFDIEKLRAHLKELYPEEKKGIDDFLELCGKFIKDLNNMLEDSLNIVTKLDRIKFGIGYALLRRYPTIVKVKNMSAYELLRKYFKNEDLIHLFYIMGPGDKDAEIFPILARIGWAIDRNYYYIAKGNNQAMADAFAKAVTDAGGKIFYSEPVEKIIIENKQAIGISTKKGKKYFAKNIVSNADAHTTYFKFIGRENMSEKAISKIEQKKPYASSFVVNLGLDYDLAEKGFHGESITYMPSSELDDISGCDPKKCKIVMQFRSLRDRTLAPEHKSGLMITARIPYEYQNIWKTGGSGVKNKDYYALKEEVAECLITSAEHIIPDLREHIVVKDISTPLTFETFTGNYKGAIMGWKEKNISLPNLHIKNFYQVGHWTFPGGSLNRVVACGKNAYKMIMSKEKR